MMNRVLYALSPVCLAAVYYFGWRALAGRGGLATGSDPPSKLGG